MRVASPPPLRIQGALRPEAPLEVATPNHFAPFYRCWSTAWIGPAPTTRELPRPVDLELRATR